MQIGGDIMKDNKMKEIIAHNLKFLREKHGLSQTDLGKELGKDKTTISTWERGVSMPDVVTLYGLSKRYNVSIDTFYIDSVDTIVEMNPDRPAHKHKIKKRISKKSIPTNQVVMATKDGLKLVELKNQEENIAYSIKNKQPKAKKAKIVKAKPIIGESKPATT
jgi:transcriptional regulator with XRE-family HTH domain